MSRKALLHAADDFDSFNMANWYGTPERMNRAHRHQEVELNFLERGEMLYLFGGREIKISAGKITLFWAAFPHCLLDVTQDTLCHWVTIPLSYILQWQLPLMLTRQILNGEIVTDASSSRLTSDSQLFHQWSTDLKEETTSLLNQHRQVVLLEIEARLRRLALSLEKTMENTTRPAQPMTRTDAHVPSKPAQMARFITDHYRDAIGVADVARSVGLHPNYAMRLFRSHFAISIIQYLVQHRLFHAQHLLLTTERTVLDIALESGFGSISQFYAVFDKLCGQSPGNYRSSLKQG